MGYYFDVFIDDDGQWYLFFGSFWTGIKAIRLDAKTGKAMPGDPEVTPVARRAPEVPDDPIEAAYVIKRGGWYYLFVSWDHCCKGATSDYKIVVGRSKKVLGPYRDASGVSMLAGGGTLLLESDRLWAGPGHNGGLRLERGDFLFHHAYRRGAIEYGRQLVVRPVEWTAREWPKLGGAINRVRVAE